MSRSLPLVAALAALSVGLPAHAKRAGVVTGVVNLNTATEAQLEMLPGIGPAKAHRIVELRQQRRLTATDQVMQVKGIGPKSYRKLKPFLTVAGPTTLHQEAKSTTAGAVRHPTKPAGRTAEHRRQAKPAPQPETASP